MTTSDKKTARLLATYVQMVAERWEEITAGRWRLYLGVAIPSPAITQLRELTVIASAAADEAGFRTEVELPGRADQGVRSRLVHVDALILDKVRGRDDVSFTLVVGLLAAETHRRADAQATLAGK